MSSKKMPAKDNRHTVAIIGCGRIGFGYDKGKKSASPRSHFSAFHSSPFFKVESVVEPDKNIRSYIEGHFAVRTYAQYADWANAERPDVVVIASPDATHDTILTSLLEVRPKMVLCEKPLTLSSTRTKELVRLYKKQHIGLSINYSRRFIPEYQEIQRMLKEKKLGNIQLVTIFYSRGFLHNGSHYIDLIQWFFGKPKKIIKETKRTGLPHDDTYACTFLYPNGAEVRLLGIDASKLLINEIDIIGDTGRIQIDTAGTMTVSKVRGVKEFQPFMFFFPVTKKRLSLARSLPGAVKNIAEYLENGTKLISSAEDDIKNASLLSEVKNTPCLT